MHICSSVCPCQTVRRLPSKIISEILCVPTNSWRALHIGNMYFKPWTHWSMGYQWYPDHVWFLRMIGTLVLTILSDLRNPHHHCFFCEVPLLGKFGDSNKWNVSFGTDKSAQISHKQNALLQGNHLAYAKQMKLPIASASAKMNSRRKWTLLTWLIHNMPVRLSAELDIMRSSQYIRGDMHVTLMEVTLK